MYPIDFFWRAAKRWPTNVAIDSPTGVVLYEDLAERVRALATAFMSIDPTLQARVGICALNGVDHIVALLATLACGKVWVPLNPKSTVLEIRRILDATEPSIVVLDAPSRQLIGDFPAHLVHCGAGMQGDLVQALIKAFDSAPQPVFDLPLEATQAIKFTGGTTGLPKGVMQPYRAWLANIANQIHMWELTQADRYVIAAPITHGTSTYILPVLAQGGAHVIVDGSGAQAVRDAFREHGGSVCFMPPTLLYMLMALPGASRNDFPDLRRLIYGGASMPPEKIRQVRDFFGPVLCTHYGQTEAPQILTAMRPDDFEDPARHASVGRVTWFCDLAVKAPDGRLLPSGETGEIVARGDLLMSGYWRLPEKTADTIIDGWLHTGDRGYIDGAGYLYLKDRLKDLVITGGFNVYPTDVENALGQHPAVHECAVFGIPDEKWGEVVQAAVQMRSGQHADETELIAFVRERLGPVQTPKNMHFYSDLPRSTVGKVMKSVLVTDAQQKRMVVPQFSEDYR